MENDLNMHIYDSSGSSSNEFSDSEPECTEGEENGQSLLKNRKYSSNEAVDCNFGLSCKRQNIVFKLYNRERNGYFANDHRKKRKEYAYNKVPKRLSFCLKEIVPYCYLKGHVFMGLTVCGQFLLSYKVSYHEENNSNVYNFNTEYKYELFFWIYRPYHLLGKYYKVCLFDDHGVDNFKIVTMTQWIENPRTLVIHGASEMEEGNSHITIVSVPKLGCLDCKKMRDDYSDDYFRCDALCIKCNLTIHTKYSRTESDPKFLPEINLSCPNKIIMMGNGFIHMININLQVPKISSNNKLMMTLQTSSNTTDIACEIVPLSLTSTSLSNLYSHNSMNILNETLDSCNSVMAADQINLKKISHLEHHYNKSDDSNNKFSNHGCDNSNKILSRNSIVDKIIADFAECETDCAPILDKNQILSRIDKSFLSNTKTFDELVITCPTTIASTNTNSDNNSTGDNTQPSKKPTGSNIRLVNHNFNKIRKCVQSIRTSCSSLLSPAVANQSNVPASTSKQVYEFSEDNENCEKISTFRKRRLADKKYEFSDYNSENIIPFNINLRKRVPNRMHASPTRAGNVVASTSSASSSIPTTTSFSSSQPTSLSYGLFNGSPSNFEVTTHQHRASPSHGFRSPCGSPVGNRCLRSPPGFKPNYFNSRSPTYSMRSPTTAQGLTLSPRQYSKKLSTETIENIINGFQSPKREDIENLIRLGISSPSSSTFNGCDNVKFTTLSSESKDSDKPICSKRFVRHFVEEDDATSVITSEEDDCISPGYHTSLPMEVHGSCYSDMQMISHASYQKLKCPTVIVTQHSLDLEAFTFHVANHLCNSNNKKYGIFYDWACEMIHVCSLSCIITLLLMVHFTARDQLPSNSKQCYNCTSNLDCVFHRKLYQCQVLFTWNIETGEWHVLDYGTLHEVPDKKNSGELNSIAQQLALELKSKMNLDEHLSTNHLRVLDCCNEKPKLFLRDYRNSIEFYRNVKKFNLNFD